MIINATDEQVIKMGKLAVLASYPVGLGFLNANPNLKEEDIILEIRNDFNPGLFIDYYQGRMVKFRGWKKDTGIWEFPDIISFEYESWIRRYVTYQKLFEASVI